MLARITILSIDLVVFCLHFLEKPFSQLVSQLHMWWLRCDRAAAIVTQLLPRPCPFRAGYVLTITARCTECSVEHFQHAWALGSQVCLNHEALTQVCVPPHTHPELLPASARRNLEMLPSPRCVALFAICADTSSRTGYYSKDVFLRSAILPRLNIIQPNSCLWSGDARVECVRGAETEEALSCAVPRFWRRVASASLGLWLRALGHGNICHNSPKLITVHLAGC